VWEPILVTDWSRPGAVVVGRIPDVRAHHYWDPSHQVARKLAADARDPQPRQECCVRDGKLWDLAAVYAPGAQWNGQLPPAVFFNGAVARVKSDLEKAVAVR